MPPAFVRKGSRDTGAQRSLFDPTVAPRSFERRAHRTLANPGDPRAPRFRMTDDQLRQRLAELDVERRRAQIRARKAVDTPEAAALPLPFPERAAC